MKRLESGRSMIEMLGVLAIMGILTIGGLAGYSLALNHIRSNQVLHYISRCVLTAQTGGFCDKLETDKNCSQLLEDEPFPVPIVSAQPIGNILTPSITITWKEDFSKTENAFEQQFNTSSDSFPHLDQGNSQEMTTKVNFFTK